MFIELMPLLENRPLIITVAALSEGRIRVNVVPQTLAKDNKANEKIGYANKDKVAQIPESAIHALTPPLSLTGRPTVVTIISLFFWANYHPAEADACLSLRRLPTLSNP
jgi:hypothetical protein